MLFSFAERDYFEGRNNTDSLPEAERSDTSIHMTYHGCIGSGRHPYYEAEGGGNWVDGALDAWDHESTILKFNEEHTVTVTYDAASNGLVLYIDGSMAQYSLDASWKVLADLSPEDIHNLTSLIIGRSNDGFSGHWGFGTYSDLVIYPTALNNREVSVLVNEGWEAVKDYKEPEYILEKDALELTGKGDGTFTAAAFNVDGLPNQISLDLGAYGKKNISLNPDGPGADKTEILGKLIAEKGWDIIGVSENFTYGDKLSAGLKDYEEINKNKDTVPTDVSSKELLSHFDQSKGYPYPFISLDTDGLSLFYNKATVSVDQEKKVAWEENYSPYKGYGIEIPSMNYYEYFYNIPQLNGADKLITKGFRHFVAEVANGVKVDVYTLHMDADNAPGDKNARAEQLKQLAKYIVDSKTKNPIIIMGDTNCRYTRDDVIANLIGVLNAEDNLYAVDAWVETKKDGNYPEFASKTLSEEIVDKIIYVNNSQCDYQLCLTKYEEVKLVDETGASLSDHAAVVGTFAYAKKYNVTYTDGAKGTAFKSQTYPTLSTNPTPKFEGTPTRDGYKFTGWEPAVTDTVTGDVTYVATWEAVPTSTPGTTDPGTTPGGTTPGGQVTPPTTGDTAHVAALITVLALSGIGMTTVIRFKKKDR